MIYQRFLALCLALSTAGLLSGFELPVPDEWAKRDTGCEIIISEPNVDSGFLIPWDRKDEEITVIPIPDASASSDNSLVIVPVYSSFPSSISIDVEEFPS